MVEVSGGNGTDNVVGERYRLLRRLGQQASTELWEAFDVRLERPVALRLLARASRQNRGAQDRLHRAARERLVDDAPGAPRVLDGGDDPTYGPFVVAELSSGLEVTQPLSFGNLPTAPADTLPAYAPPAPADEPRALTRPRRAVLPGHQWGGGFGVVALLALVLVVLAAAVFLAGAFAPSKSPVDAAAAGPTPGQATRPLSGAPAGQPAATPTLVPTLAAPAPATLAPTAQPEVQPTPAPVAPTAAPATPPTPAAPATAPTPAAVTMTRQPAPTPAPAESVQVVAGSPVATIREHYALIDARRFADGYTLMDAHLRSLNSPADYAGWFANKVSIKPISIDLVSQTDSQAVVRSVVQTTDRLNGQNVTTQVAEQFVLRNEDGAWHIAQVSRV